MLLAPAPRRGTEGGCDPIEVKGRGGRRGRWGRKVQVAWKVHGADSWCREQDGPGGVRGEAEESGRRKGKRGGGEERKKRRKLQRCKRDV